MIVKCQFIQTDNPIVYFISVFKVEKMIPIVSGPILIPVRYLLWGIFLLESKKLGLTI